MGPRLVMDVHEVAKLLGVRAGTIYRLVRCGDIPGFKVGGQWRFSRTVLESWMTQRSRPDGERRIR
jgi:excisionase family DNA binding protein